MHINSTLEPQWNQFWKFLGGCFSNRYPIGGGSMHIHLGIFEPLGAWASASHEPLPSPSLSALARRSLRHGEGTHGLVMPLCQPWGRYFNLGAGCQKWKPLDTPGTQPLFSDAVVNSCFLASYISLDVQTCDAFVSLNGSYLEKHKGHSKSLHRVLKEFLRSLVALAVNSRCV